MVRKHSFVTKMRKNLGKSNDTYLVASEHMRTTCLPLALKTLKKTGVNSSRFFEANVKSPKGPIPPWIFEPFLPQSVWASRLLQLGLNSSALAKLGSEKITSTSACKSVHQHVQKNELHKFKKKKKKRILGFKRIKPEQQLFP